MAFGGHINCDMFLPILDLSMGLEAAAQACKRIGV